MAQEQKEHDVAEKIAAKYVEKTVNRVGRTPDYKGDGVAVWKNLDKNGKEYLAVKILGNITVAAFKPKADKEEAELEAAAKEVTEKA